MIVLGSRTIEVTKEVPVEIVNSAEVVPATDTPDHVTFRLTGPKAFLRAILDRREEPIRLNTLTLYHDLLLTQTVDALRIRFRGQKIVNGKVLMKDRKVLTLDKAAVIADANKLSLKVREAVK